MKTLVCSLLVLIFSLGAIAHRAFEISHARHFILSMVADNVDYGAT
jgi:hypothetical protein